QINSEQPRRKTREEPDDKAGPNEVAHCVRDGDVVQQSLLLEVWQIEPGDRVTRRANDCALCECSSHEARSSAAVIPEHCRCHNGHYEARHTQDYCYRHL